MMSKEHEAILGSSGMSTRSLISLDVMQRERAARSWAAGGKWKLSLRFRREGKRCSLGHGPRWGVVLPFRLRSSNLVLRP